MNLVPPSARDPRPAARRFAAGRPSSERGIALVITLILLSVTLIMALAFLALSRREREAVATATDATQARLAADNALAAAQAQIVANIFANNNAFNYGLLVSTNYLNPNGYNTATLVTDPLNVSYNYPAGGFLTGDDLARNIGNLQILPRPPVFISGNPVTNGTDFRFYLDLNRNGRFETNGVIGEIGASGLTTGNQLFAVGDPEWVGVLERPDTTHSPINKFVSRYAFMAVPADNALDINAIHNQALIPSLNLPNKPMDLSFDGYFRNQGVGSWELNLAAFLADLNPDIWDNPVNGGAYQYLRPSFKNTGTAFNDAFAILTNRYAGIYNTNTLPAASQVFSNFAKAFVNDRIDEYSDGPLQTTLNTNDDFVADVVTTPWPGSDNTNRFYALPSDLFDSTKLPQTFIKDLSAGGSSNATFDRYTFYRLLSQLGTDSSVEPPKLNLNFKNVDDYGNIIPGMETNQIRWTNGLVFFTNAADRLLHLYTTNWFQSNPSSFLLSYYNILVQNPVGPSGYGLTNIPYFGMTNQIPGFGIGNIPVYLNGRFIYSTAINRLLQLAANIYDASTNSYYPSVFRPLLNVYRNGVQTNIYINGYEQISSVSGLNDSKLSPPVDISYLPTITPPNISYSVSNYNVYGVPWIIGAKKGFPNFQHLSLVNQMQLTRKLHFFRPYVGGPISTNEGYFVTLTNYLSLAYWNSYATSYPGTLTVYALDTLKMIWSNSPSSIVGGAPQFFVFQTNVVNWPGSGWASLPESAKVGLPSAFVAANFYYPFNFLYPNISQSPVQFWASDGTFHWDTNNFDPGSIRPLPPINLMTTNWLYSVILDGSHVIDFVELASPSETLDVTNVLADDYFAQQSPASMWGLDFKSGIPSGVYNQIEVSEQGANINPNFWQVPPNFPTGGGAAGLTPQQNQQLFFRNFLSGNSANTELSVQAPYTPTRILTGSYLLQANDPLVHYLASDLGGKPGSDAVWGNQNLTNGFWGHSDIYPLPPSVSTTALPGRYQPWGILNQMKKLTTNSFDSMLKDPLVWGSDYWDFPTNSYPTVGWLGRVHRGTPWQTVYLKANDPLQNEYQQFAGQLNPVGTNIWMNWTGDLDPFDGTNSAPLQDRLLFDVFTTKLNDNATRGTLSVNQTNLADWSALFSGMVAMKNTTVSPKYQPLTNLPSIMNPVSVGDGALWQIYKDINSTRANTTLFPGQYFSHVGDILSVPSLTTSSPFLNTKVTFFGNQPAYGISDEMYEWLPQQMLSLVRASPTPRYVVYGYGQALRPAQGSTYSGTGPLFGLVTNYQVMAESAVRAVVQVHPQILTLPYPQVIGNITNYYATNYTTTVESYDVLPPN